MARKLRYVPEGGALVEVTCRCVGAQHLLRPDETVNELVIGVVGRAQRLTSMTVCSLVVLSTHFHMLLFVRDAGQLADFMRRVNVGISKEISAHIGRKGSFWERRYQAILVSEEETAQVDRLVYQLRHGVKEGLVSRPEQWPGVQTASCWLDGEELVGHWFDRTKESAARRRGRVFDRLAYATRETILLSPLPCWTRRGLSTEEIRRAVRELVRTIVEDGEADRRSSRKQVLGIARILATPRDAVSSSARNRPAPYVHAASRDVREAYVSAYGTFLLAYRQASVAYRGGRSGVVFPDRCFPPAKPFFPGQNSDRAGDASERPGSSTSDYRSASIEVRGARHPEPG